MLNFKLMHQIPSKQTLKISLLMAAIVMSEFALIKTELI